MSDFQAGLLEYVGLTFDDRDAIDILAAARALAASRVPGYEWNELSLPAAVAEIAARAAEETIFAVNRLPRVLGIAQARLAGLEPLVGSPGVVTATLTLAAATTTTIPAGTIVAYEDEGETWQFVLDSAVTITSPATTGVGQFTGVDRLAAVNSVPVGTSLRIISPVAALASVVTTSTVSGAADPETGDAFLRRWQLLMRRWSEALVLPSSFQAYVEGETGGRALVIERYNGDGTGAPYVDAGHVTVVARGPSGDLTAGRRAELATEMEAMVPAGVQVHVVAPTYTAVNVTVTVVPRAGVDNEVVRAAVIAAIGAWLNPSTWPWAAVVRNTDLIAVIEGVDGVDYISDLSPSDDLGLAGDGPLATAGAITVVVA